MSEDSTKKILAEIIAAQDEVTANKIVANLQKSFMVNGNHDSNHPSLGSQACVGVSCSGLVNCPGVHTVCSPQACDTMGATGHDCKPVACGKVNCDNMGNY